MIRYSPLKLLKKVAPERLVKRMTTKNLSLNRATLKSLSGAADILGRKKLEKVALKVIRQYRKKYSDLREEGESVTEARDTSLNGSVLMVQRVQNEIVFEIKEEIKHTYRGEMYEWLPSDADEPDPEHQLNYGKRFTIGKGEMPGDRPGCRCGMRILVEEEELDLSEDE